MREGFDKTLRTLRDEMQETIRELKDVDVMLDPDGEGTVSMPVSLYFQVLGIITWLSNPGEADGDDSS